VPHELKWKLIKTLAEISPDWLYAFLIFLYSTFHPYRRSVLVVPRDGSWYGIKNGLAWTIPSPKYAILLIEQTQPYEQFFEVDRGNVVFDIGGGIGRTATHFGKKVGKEGLVVVVEPDPGCLFSLRKNLGKREQTDNIKIIPKAAWNLRGTLTFSSMPGLASIKVEADTLDNIFSELGLKKVDFMKIDVDGVELKVLEGARRVLNTTKYVVLETHRKEDGTRTTNSVRRFLEAQGFKVRVCSHFVYAWSARMADGL